MIELSNSTAQTLAVGDALVFDRVILKTGCGECHRPNTGSVKMMHRGIYAITFGGNIGGVAEGDAELSIELGGEILPETTMNVVSAAAGDLENVSRTTRVKNGCCDYSRITVVNSGAASINVDANATLIVEEV